MLYSKTAINYILYLKLFSKIYHQYAGFLKLMKSNQPIYVNFCIKEIIYIYVCVCMCAYRRDEDISEWKAHTNTRKLHSNLSTLTDVFPNQTRINVYEYTEKTAPRELQIIATRVGARLEEGRNVYVYNIKVPERYEKCLWRSSSVNGKSLSTPPSGRGLAMS